MEWHYDIAFYAFLFFISSAAGLATTLLDRRFRSVSELFVTGFLSGCSAVAIIGIICRNVGATSGSEPLYVGLAISIGLFGKQGIKITRQVTFSALRKFGVQIDEDGNI